MELKPGLRILVVDQDALVGRVTCQQLEKSGHLAKPLSTATDLSNEHGGDWDVILADICLPHESGIVLVRQLVAKFPSAHLVVMTAHWTSADTIREVLRLGAWDSLTKPFRIGDLLAALEGIPRARKAGCRR